MKCYIFQHYTRMERDTAKLGHKFNTRPEMAKLMEQHKERCEPCGTWFEETKGTTQPKTP